MDFTDEDVWFSRETSWYLRLQMEVFKMLKGKRQSTLNMVSVVRFVTSISKKTTVDLNDWLGSGSSRERSTKRGFARLWGKG